MTYQFLSDFAESWALAAMVVLFAVLILWAFRPGSGETYRKAARSLLDDHDSEV